MKIVVGLGNPGRKYYGTRHNVGFDVLDLLARRFAADPWKNRFQAETTEVLVGSERLLLLAPQTYMNLSGRSVRSAVDFFKASLSDLLLVCDDLNLPTGRVRLRASGSAGGQKGLKNTIDQLGSEQFARLRIGIGRPSAGADVTNYVLQAFSRSDRTVIDEAIEKAAAAVETWATRGVDAAMNQFNRSEDSDNES